MLNFPLGVASVMLAPLAIAVAGEKELSQINKIKPLLSTPGGYAGILS